MASRSKGIPPPPPPKPKKKKSKSKLNNDPSAIASETDQTKFHLTGKDLVEIADLTKLQPLTEDLVLRCLKTRYQTNRFYTWAGVSLLALNPLRDFPALYSTKSIWEYHLYDGPVKDLPPHVFSVAKWAYFSMVHSLGKSVDQSVIVSGESGAGKTESTRFLMKYLAAVGGRTGDEDTTAAKESSRASTPDTGFCSPSWPAGTFPAFLVKKHLMASTPIIEAFGNASTQRNDNSSRFGKFIQLQFDRGASVLGGKIETYLLESTRVVYQAPKERNFHIFYQLLHGLKKTARKSDCARLAWMRKCRMVRDGEENGDGVTTDFALAFNGDVRPEVDADDFDTTVAAMRDAELSNDQIGQIFAILSAILNLGQIEFDGVGAGADGEMMRSASDQRALDNAADLMGLAPDFLFLTLTTRKFSTTRMKRTSTVVGRCSKEDSKNKRDALCKLLYTRLFEWIINYINSIISKEKRTYSRIGLLDIYGFEILDINSLEQLCINFANEKLQQLYVHQYLQQLQEDLKREEVKWISISYNDNRPCLDALEKGPESIIGMLNEECQLNRDVDNVRLVQRIDELKNPVLKRVAMNSPSLRRQDQQRGPEEAFTVKHYAGSVNYSLTNMVEKNKDKVAQDLVDLVEETENGFLKELFADWENPNLLRGESRRQTLLSKFKTSLDTLMLHLRATTPHYIRCVKPSPLNPACFNGPNAVHLKDGVSMFDVPTVEQQLRATGILETVAISKQLCPVRLSFDEFLHRYGLLVISNVASSAEMPDVIPGEVNVSLVTAASKTFASGNKRRETEESRLKRKKRRTAFEGVAEESMKKVAVDSAVQLKFPKVDPAPPISSCASSKSEDSPIVDARRDRVSEVMASIFDNNNFMLGKSKIFLTEAQFQTLEKRREAKLNEKAFTIQCAWRRHRRERRLESVLLMQAVVRGFLQRRRFNKTRSVVLKIQSIHRGIVVRKRVEEEKRAAAILVRFFRGLGDRREFLKKRAAVVVLQDAFRRWKMRKLQRLLAASRKHSSMGGKTSKFSKGKTSVAAAAAPAPRSRTSVGFSTPPPSMDAKNRSFDDADASTSSNRTLYFTPEAMRGERNDAGRRKSGEMGGESEYARARGDGEPSPKASRREFLSVGGVTSKKKLTRDFARDEKENHDFLDTANEPSINRHSSSTATNHTYPDLLRSLTPSRSPSVSKTKPVNASPTISSISSQSTSISSRSSPGKLPSPNGFSDVAHSNRDVSTWRFRPLEELQRREQRRGSIVFNQRGCVKELPEVPYVEISARGNIVSRRRLTRVPIRFHLTTGEILTNAHVLPWQELSCSITDCLPAYDHVYCNKKHCATEHIKG